VRAFKPSELRDGGSLSQLAQLGWIAARKLRLKDFVEWRSHDDFRV
jgi:hypothetical protein